MDARSTPCPAAGPVGTLPHASADCPGFSEGFDACPECALPESAGSCGWPDACPEGCPEGCPLLVASAPGGVHLDHSVDDSGACASCVAGIEPCGCPSCTGTPPGTDARTAGPPPLYASSTDTRVGGELRFGHIVLTRFYGLLWRLARPILRRNKRLADGFARRLVPADWAEPADVWMQAASGGEAYLVWETLARLAVREQGTRVLVTTWTRQGLETLHGMAARLRDERPDLHVAITLFPLDQPSLMLRALDMVAPRVVVLMETELWPGLLMACRRRKTPLLVLNGRLSPGSLRRCRWLERLSPGFWRALAPQRIAAISEPDAARFSVLFGADTSLKVIPNIKFDRAEASSPASSPVSAGAAPEARAELPGAGQARELARLLPEQAPLLFASVREEEEALLLPTLRELLPLAPLLIAPRHMHRIEAWQAHCTAAGLPFVLRSTLDAASPAPTRGIILWDRFGELAGLHALAGAVFVGGSLAPLGGQNFLEALSAGRIPCVGPHLTNFAWALDHVPTLALSSLAQAGLLRVCSDSASLPAVLGRAYRQAPDPGTVRARFLAWLRPRLGGARRCAALVDEVLQRHSG